MNESIRPITIAESADAAARTAVETHEEQPNPHPPGSDNAAAWRSAYLRYNLLYSSAELEVEGGA